jgi:hypothetical protein
MLMQHGDVLGDLLKVAESIATERVGIGQRVDHWQHGEGVITEILSDDYVRVQFESGAYSLSTDNLTDEAGAPLTTSLEEPFKPRVKKPLKTLPTEITPSSISDVFIEHCRTFGIAIALQSPESDVDRMYQILEANGINVPPGFRPIQFGTRGGFEESQTRTFKLRAATPMPTDPSIIPVKYYVKGDTAYIYNTAFVMGLLVAGFSITSWNADREEVDA